MNGVYSNSNAAGLDKQARQKEILDFLKANSSASVADLCERFQVSEMTIRRDLQELDRIGLLRRVHGGAMLGASRSYEPPYKSRVVENAAQKKAIARRAAAFVVDGDSLALDNSTTTIEMVEFLTARLNLTIVTASLSIAMAVAEQFHSNSGLRLIVTGGVVRPGEMSLVGDFAQTMLRELHVDKAFIGVGAIDITEGFTEYNLDDAFVKRALVSSANEVYVLADSSKFQRSTFASVGALDIADAIITDTSIPEKLAEQIRARGIEVILAE